MAIVPMVLFMLLCSSLIEVSDLLVMRSKSATITDAVDEAVWIEVSH